ncbi:DUF421 domain-containing protein [Planococcus sp. CPCC 101016]|uniref:DUF421 domain-containing protein n=1 Tax=Planococcus sp. CPCC 101016 TaxID=2599617 RepID=UPI0011B455D4|nr:YetF domain-containing protein [Planococcus sp. CPCC 101016]TWT08017.1 DUF421 domain-containing protein [Planococcus sp. CPCC 101016]
METLLFDGWKSIFRVVLMCILAYPFLILLLRLFGKRTLSEISIFDFIITVTYGATLSSIITSDKVSFADGAAILFMLTLLQYMVSRLSVKSKRFSDFIKASPTFLYHSNHFNEEIMKQNRLRIEDLRAKVRQQGISSFEKVEAIVLEGDGSLSIVKKEDVMSKDALDGIGEEKTKSSRA